VDREDPARVDLAEPLELAGRLAGQGAPCLNVSVGNPYFDPWHNRPADRHARGVPVPEEHPLRGVHRMIWIARRMQTAHPDLAIIGSGYTYLRHFMPWFAAGAMREGGAGLIGLGRQAFAYPDFARDVLGGDGMDPGKCCIACSRCTELMRDGKPTGCVVRDRRVYGPLYREGRDAP
jgi:2,4-dienoyl-CoA reductase-like NADH-dependent reductase (Old Yellow Enzyme family)